ncbi:MAG: type II secretion system protein GspE [Candidatus Hydrogenedentota bacterium]|nr:MAG: type II secretion system protein GspE [Candidatus Hydrogenedentota bacterium]
MKQKKKIGEWLLSAGVIDKESLEKALKLQEKSDARIGEILYKKGLISESDLLQALSKQFGFPVVEKLEPKNLEKIAEKISLPFLQKARIVPYALQGNLLYVAISDPTKIHLLDEFRSQWLGYDLKIALAAESEILRFIHAHFEKGGEEALDLEDNFDFTEDLEDLRDSMDLANEAPIIRMVNMILTNAVSQRASDIHIEPQEKELSVRYRVDGILHKVLTPPKGIQNGIISRIKIMADLNIAENRLPQDGRIKIRFGGKDIDIRVSTLPTQYGERVVMRLLNKTDTKYELENIGFEKEVYDTYTKLLDLPNGIILITGPTGSGKTSTLYASLARLNDESRNIITVEDPVEYQIDGISQVQAKSEIGLTFAEGLRSILRQDPDVIMVGEIRDEETARVAIQASLTGHLVFSTLHTNDAPSGVTRLLDMNIEPYLITSTCQAFMAQRLVRVLCPHCKKKTSISAAELRKLGLKSLKGNARKTVFTAVGCKECMHTGYHGRTGVYELFVLDEETRHLILTNPGLDALRKAALAKGLVTLREAALKKVLAGITSIEEALRVT